METIKLDMSCIGGKIKTINAVNNGPAGSKVRMTGNADLYSKLEIPYARNHDASFYSGYGGEYIVDVHRIFENFDADENDPANYLFDPTDKYLAAINEVGTKVFYRLGASIEHGHKKGTYPPKDFHKWARICEHIIRHYTEGWADGFNYYIEYWEIWNEPECRNADGSNPCWQGTEAEFIDFYEIAAKHLKSKFPSLKIGGPAFTSSWPTQFKADFLNAVKERNIPLDFYSFHGYMRDPEFIQELSDKAMASLVNAGLTGENGERPELIFNEWNYIRGWLSEEYKYSIRTIKNNKGASFVAGSMCIGQASDIDMMMYYDARPCAFCGLFDTTFLKPLKTYYTFDMVKELPRLGSWVKAPAQVGSFYSCAATDGRDSAVIITHYNDDENTQKELVKVAFENVKSKNGVRVEYYLLDDDHDAELIREEIFTSERFATYLDMKLYDTYLIKIKTI